MGLCQRPCLEDCIGLPCCNLLALGMYRPSFVHFLSRAFRSKRFLLNAVLPARVSTSHIDELSWVSPVRGTGVKSTHLVTHFLDDYVGHIEPTVFDDS